MMRRRVRRRIDLAVALVIAVIVGLAGVILWRSSDVRATTLNTTPTSEIPTTPSPASAVPTALREIWSLRTDPKLGAVVSPYGSVVTADAHTVTGHDLNTAGVLWSYSRTNVPLCAIGSADTDTAGLDVWGAIRGIVTVFAKNGWCSQITTLNPTTGERLYQRTSPNQDPGQLVFGGPYMAWMGTDLMEVWRHDLYRTIQYGNQPNPVNSDGPHTGCTFSDAALADQQFATIEHCKDKPGVAQLVINWADPSNDAKDKGWDAMHSQPRATINTGSPTAVLVGITADRVAIVVTRPKPEIVIYDNAGKQISRRVIAIPAAEITKTAAAGVTPSVSIKSIRYTLIGNRLLAVSSQSVQAPAPTTSSSQSTHPTAITQETRETVTVDSPHLDWVVAGVLGLPTRVASTILAATPKGLTEYRVSDGRKGRTIPINRDGYHGRVDVTAVGTVFAEVRGGTVVGYSAP
jgi:hypothetical protein